MVICVFDYIDGRSELPPVETVITFVCDRREVMEQELGVLIKRKDNLDKAFEAALTPQGYIESDPTTRTVYRVYDCEVFQFHNEGLKGLIK